MDPWMRHMQRGEFEAAWEISDRVLRSRAGVSCRHLPRHQQYVWDGTPLAGKRVLIRCYHGLGDTLQFIRYAPLVREVAAEVTVWAQPELIPLLRSARGIDRLLPLHDAAPEVEYVEYDVDVEVMELPHVFRTTLRTLPAEVPYLHADPVPLPRDGRLAVGLVWRAGSWDERRSVPVELLTPLARIPGVALHVLQRGPALAERPEGFGVVSGSDDAMEAAGILRALDLLVSVDTMPAHLAGALGVPVWTLLHSDPDWRWIEGSDDSPWYPTMRLFRQERPGEWEAVVARVAAELELAGRYEGAEAGERGAALHSMRPGSRRRTPACGQRGALREVSEVTERPCRDAGARWWKSPGRSGRGRSAFMRRTSHAAIRACREQVSRVQDVRDRRRGIRRISRPGEDPGRLARRELLLAECAGLRSRPRARVGRLLPPLSRERRRPEPGGRRVRGAVRSCVRDVRPKGRDPW
ncbi:MAG TPA: hypothetical protein VHG28_06750 [Longimicrobiaceae bacterium]|nr:hypothetical protein [Longimicrobiaceae bacterium]